MHIEFQPKEIKLGTDLENNSNVAFGNINIETIFSEYFDNFIPAIKQSDLSLLNNLHGWQELNLFSWACRINEGLAEKLLQEFPEEIEYYVTKINLRETALDILINKLDWPLMPHLHNKIIKLIEELSNRFKFLIEDFISLCQEYWQNQKLLEFSSGELGITCLMALSCSRLTKSSYRTSNFNFVIKTIEDLKKHLATENIIASLLCRLAQEYFRDKNYKQANNYWSEAMFYYSLGLKNSLIDIRHIALAFYEMVIINELTLVSLEDLLINGQHLTDFKQALLAIMEEDIRFGSLINLSKKIKCIENFLQNTKIGKDLVNDAFLAMLTQAEKISEDYLNFLNLIKKADFSWEKALALLINLNEWCMLFQPSINFKFLIHEIFSIIKLQRITYTRLTLQPFNYLNLISFLLTTLCESNDQQAINTLKCCLTDAGLVNVKELDKTPILNWFYFCTLFYLIPPDEEEKDAFKKLIMFIWRWLPEFDSATYEHHEFSMLSEFTLKTLEKIKVRMETSAINFTSPHYLACHWLLTFYSLRYLFSLNDKKQISVGSFSLELSDKALNYFIDAVIANHTLEVLTEKFPFHYLELFCKLGMLLTAKSPELELKAISSSLLLLYRLPLDQAAKDFRAPFAAASENQKNKKLVETFTIFIKQRINLLEKNISSIDSSAAENFSSENVKIIAQPISPFSRVLLNLYHIAKIKTHRKMHPIDHETKKDKYKKNKRENKKQAAIENDNDIINLIKLTLEEFYFLCEKSMCENPKTGLIIFYCLIEILKKHHLISDLLNTIPDLIDEVYRYEATYYYLENLEECNKVKLSAISPKTMIHYADILLNQLAEININNKNSSTAYMEQRAYEIKYFYLNQYISHLQRKRQWHKLLSVLSNLAIIAEKLKDNNKIVETKQKAEITNNIIGPLNNSSALSLPNNNTNKISHNNAGLINQTQLQAVLINESKLTPPLAESLSNQPSLSTKSSSSPVLLTLIPSTFFNAPLPKNAKSSWRMGRPFSKENSITNQKRLLYPVLDTSLTIFKRMEEATQLKINKIFNEGQVVNGKKGSEGYKYFNKIWEIKLLGIMWRIWGTSFNENSIRYVLFDQFNPRGFGH